MLKQLPRLEGRGIAPLKTHRGLSFWAIIIALSISSILIALENTAVTTSFAGDRTGAAYRR